MTERRETKWKYEAYRGPKIDRDFTGPGPWEVNVFPREKFQKDKIKLEIPKSEYTKTCHRCNGWRMMTCSYCSGRGSVIHYLNLLLSKFIII